MITISRREDCCGCYACEQICPKNCISMVSDNEGFKYPKIDIEKCISCSLCDKVCPVNNQTKEREPLEVYAAINKNEDIRSKSSSGGIFTLLAEKVIDNNGVVFGVRFDNQWNVVFGYSDNIEDLQYFRGSKYVQPDINGVYRKVLDYLKEGIFVLFVGLPCHISGLRLFLGKDYNNLLLVDLICEGVPSPKVWRRYLDEEVARLCSKYYKFYKSEEVEISDISFRYKKCGWKNYALSISLRLRNEESFLLPAYVNRNSAYMQAMFHYVDLRPICYECPFKSCKSGSDITIGDYWGINIQHPEMDDDGGTSLVYLNTPKGRFFFPRDNVISLRTQYQEAFCFNNIISSVKKHPNRDAFFAHIDESESIIKLMNKYTFPPSYLAKEFAKKLFFKVFSGDLYWKLQKKWKR